MKTAHFFIDRPIFATVLCVLIVIVGSLSYFGLPVAQYPEVAPPTVSVSANYPGASSEVLSKTVATPLEQAINGVEGMLYMSSSSTSDGSLNINLTFKLGTDLDIAQVQVQNRISTVEASLPEEVRRLGVSVKKRSPDLMLVVNMYSPGKTYDQTYIGNYATLQIKDVLSRIEGVGDIRVFGASDYAMRVWLDPDRIAAFGLTANEVIGAIRGQNAQVAGGTLNQQPLDKQSAFELAVRVKGRLETPEEFGNIILKEGDAGRLVRLKDVARVELSAQNFATRGYLGENPAIAMPVFQLPGTNALRTAKDIIETMKKISKDFPADLKYDIAYNPTKFVEESIHAVFTTIAEAIVLVVLVIILFLQNWRAAIIPVVAIPVSLIGTFAVMAALDFSLNNLTLFGLVLAIGIVVDDAIVVVENMERNLSAGMTPRDAARKSMNEVGAALIAMGLVLIAVFLPTSFITGISGRFYQQFGVTIAVATAISVFVSITLSPALATILLKHHATHKQSQDRTPFLLQFVYNRFNRFMQRFTQRYETIVSAVVSKTGLVIGIYLSLMVATYFVFQKVPSGFIPKMDQGYFIVAIQLPPGASLERTDKVVKHAVSKILKIDGIKNAVAFTGFSGASFSNASNAAAIFTPLQDFATRRAKGLTYDGLLGTLRQELSQIDDAFIIAIPPPSVRGIGSGGGFKMMVQDRSGQSIETLFGVVQSIVGAANQGPSPVTSVYSFFDIGTPQLFLDIDRDRAEKLGLNVSDVFDALQGYMGSSYVNDFNFLGRTYQVTAQADAPYRTTIDDISRIRVRNKDGNMVPIGSIAQLKDIAGPSRLIRYNLYPAIDLSGDTAAGYSTGEALDHMEKLATQLLPPGFSFEWTELALQEKLAGNTGPIAFTLAVVFVFLLLAAQFESWTLPLAVILIVPMCLFSAMSGVAIAGMDNNILTQIGLVVLVGLASKNAILIIEFAKQREDAGKTPWEAAVEAAKLRLRPILMTSFAFILGVLPLVTASGAGAEMRQTLGTAVFSGMLGVTFFGLVFTPVFYVLCRTIPAKFWRNDTATMPR